MSALIKIESLSHIYHINTPDEFIALEDINLTINQGEFIAIIGTNGSGKSTLAKHLNALLKPTSGRCIVDNIDTQNDVDLWKIRQKIGMVFQNPDNQIVATIVEEDIAFGPENIGIDSTEIKARVKKALNAVGLNKYRKHAPHLLSGGQKQRLAMAGVLAMNSKCLVLDEPTAMLDPVGRQEVLSTVKKLNSEDNITIVYITHFMEEAIMADKVIVMENGRIRLQGTPKEVFSQVLKIKKLGLDVPIAAEVSYRLQEDNIIRANNIIYDEELVEALCR
ncbi:MAG: energy-coupling factor transporter ATPase [Negativicutes bacterium]|jgi:energy-coupling factor transport system ATP-binding protein|nr:energy-coupling factor transporter ATPase [Negativicutes bacterium]MBP8628536.1 energy-coupling factor transporter ATPase [Negativicutes bacterium]MBP9536670.1 energy-coupling factor transporter ATPase [Negativicutes bacterium]MBP9948916.1 energy-coupling factor transporter ATPase [Negativicutes bacterium]